MSHTRQPGPAGGPRSHHHVHRGTMIRHRSPHPGPTGKLHADISRMAPIDRFITMIKLAVPLLPYDMQEEFSAMMSPQALGMMAGTLLLWAGSHAVGVGFLFDILLAAIGGLMAGWQIWQAAADLYASIQLTYNAHKHQDLDMAAEHFAKFVMVVGVAVVSAILLHGGARIMKGAGRATQMAAKVLAGMPKNHFNAFIEAAKESKLIIIVRNTNPASAKWIERGFPPKPMSLKLKTSKSTGIVTALHDLEAMKARKAGFLVVGRDMVVRGPGGKAVHVPHIPGCTLEPGMVLDPKALKPIVGDYDLMGVFNPKEASRNLALAVNDGKFLPDWSSPSVKNAAAAINRRLDQARVMHGAHEAYYDAAADFSDLSGGATIFYPDGRTQLLPTAQDIHEFYKSLGRQLLTLKNQ